MWSIFLYRFITIFAGFKTLFMHWYSTFFLCILITWLIIDKFIKNKDKKQISLWGITISQFLLWISLWVADFLWYEGGFPIKALTYPSCHPCGSDIPPIESLPMFLMNYLIWLLISFLIATFLSKKTIKNKKYYIIFTIISFLVLMSGLGGLLLTFD